MAFSVALKIQTFIADAYVPGVPTPTSQAWYGGDNRGFSSSDTVRFRTKQYLTFNFDNNGASWNGFTDTGETHRYTINTKPDINLIKQISKVQLLFVIPW